MAHTICGVQKIFYKKGLHLQVLVAFAQDAQMKAAPKKSCFLTTKIRDKEKYDVRRRVIATIYLKKGINHHLARLCIAHELYHTLLALDAYIAGDRKEWLQLDRQSSEEDCNKFAKELCLKHHNFYKNGVNRHRVEFPEEIFDEDFLLDLADCDRLPACLNEPIAEAAAA